MNLLHRYIFKESLVACLVAVGLFVAVLLTGNALRDVVDLVASGQMSFFSAVKVLAVLTPSIVSYALPLGILTGILVTIGKLSSHNEILAMKASGISIYNIATPIILIAMAASVFSIFVNFYYSPIAYNMYRMTFRSMAKSDPMKFMSARVFIDDFPGYVLYANGVNDGALEGFKIWQMAPDGTVEMFVKANTGRFSYDDTSDALLLNLYNGNGERYMQNASSDTNTMQASTIFFDEMTISLPMDKFFKSGEGYNKKIKHMTLGELLALRSVYLSDIKKNPSDVRLREEKMVIETQVQKNFVMSFSIFSMAILAIPLGLKVQRSERSANIALALVLSFSYYFAVIVLSWFDRMFYVRPDLIIWLPNIILQVIGLWYMKKIAKN